MLGGKRILLRPVQAEQVVLLQQAQSEDLLLQRRQLLEVLGVLQDAVGGAPAAQRHGQGQQQDQGEAQQEFVADPQVGAAVD